MTVVAAEEPSAIPAKMQLARLYEQMKEPEKALAMITDGRLSLGREPSAGVDVPHFPFPCHSHSRTKV